MGYALQAGCLVNPVCLQKIMVAAINLLYLLFECGASERRPRIGPLNIIWARERYWKNLY